MGIGSIRMSLPRWETGKQKPVLNDQRRAFEKTWIISCCYLTVMSFVRESVKALSSTMYFPGLNWAKSSS